MKEGDLSTTVHAAMKIMVITATAWVAIHWTGVAVAKTASDHRLSGITGLFSY